MDTNSLAQIVAALSQKAGESSAVTITILVIAALAPTLVALAGYLQSRAHGKDIVDLKVHVNSRMDELLQRTGESAHAAGAAEQQAAHVSEVVENGSKVTAQQVKVILDAIHKQGKK